MFLLKETINYKGGMAAAGSAHARNCRGCMTCIYEANRGYICSTAKGYIKKSCLNEEKENTGIRCNGPQRPPPAESGETSMVRHVE